MSSSPYGLDLQVNVAGHLKNQGFRLLEGDADLDHNSKIDFVVIRFPGYAKMVNIGVQITSRMNDLSKRSEFVAKNSPMPGRITATDKALYLEYDNRVEIHKGGADIVAQVLYAFQFDERFHDTKVGAAIVRAREDAISYTFFDPTAFESAAAAPAAKESAVLPAPVPAPTVVKVAAERSPANPAASQPVADLSGATSRLNDALAGNPLEYEGKIVAIYPDRRYGFIHAQNGMTYHMTLNDITDTNLREKLEMYNRETGKVTLNKNAIPVLFSDHGLTRSGVSYRSAKNIRLLSIR
jgi:hypothetical protein